MSSRKLSKLLPKLLTPVGRRPNCSPGRCPPPVGPGRTLTRAFGRGFPGGQMCHAHALSGRPRPVTVRGPGAQQALHTRTGRKHPHEYADPREAPQTRPRGHHPRTRPHGGGGPGRLRVARPGPGGHDHHLEQHRHQQRLLLLVLGAVQRRHHDPGIGQQLQPDLELGRAERRRRHRLEPGQQQHRLVLGHVELQRQLLPVAVRLDHQPADRVVHRRQLRQLQPEFGRDQAGLGQQRRQHVRPVQDDPRQRAVHRGHRDVRPVLGGPSGEAHRRHHHRVEHLQRLEEPRPEPRHTELRDPGHRGLPEQRQLQHHRHQRRQQRWWWRHHPAPQRRWRWQRQLHRDALGRPAVERPLQPERLGHRLQQLEGDGQRPDAGEDQLHLERQRQLSEQSGPRGHTQREREQLGDDDHDERHLDMAQRVLCGHILIRVS
ncbi:hypothetical protein SGPA1_21901 [Streptomyces misionensis JCM 4497]